MSQSLGRAMLKSGLLLSRPILLVLAALGLLFTIDLFALAACREMEQASDQLNRRMQVADALQALPAMMMEMQSGMRGYILTGSAVSLDRYRAAADQFPRAAEMALTLLDDDADQRKRVEGAAAAGRAWLSRYASPLVVKRNAGIDDPRTMAAIVGIMKKGQGESQAERVRARFAESIKIELEGVSAAQIALKRKLDRVAIWIRGRTIALILALAAVTLMLGRTLADLTGQIRSRELAERAMKKSSATLRAMSDASPVGMFLADPSGACVQSNATFERITGLTESTILGTGWQSALHADDRDKVAAAWRAAIAAGESFASTHRFVHRSGKVVWASMKTARMSDGDQLIGFACSIEDVSERHETEEALRKSEERLHLALESSGIALLDWHVPSGEVFLSREWNALGGYGPEALTTTARRINDLIHPDDRDALRDAIIDGFKTNKPIARTEFRIETRTGQWKAVFCRGRVTERDSVGRAVRMTGTIAAVD